MTLGEIVRRRRDGEVQSAAEFSFLCQTATDGSSPDYLLSAWLMAAYLRPLSEEETVSFTIALADSGERLDLQSIPQPHLDKHSTGGVGDKTTIALLPLLAACGLSMVKMSGRGLGITGGTVDKLASVPGFRTDLTVEELLEQTRRIGLSLSGQTRTLAPADGVFYALRDVTQTVDSIPLICASILSKKLAGGADSVLLDVKCGSGAFMTDLEQARELAGWLERVGNRCGMRVQATITDMSTPLGSAVGNSLEVREALAFLEGRFLRSGKVLTPADRFASLVLTLAGRALSFVGFVPDEAAGIRLAQEAIRSGAARAKAVEWFSDQGATVDPYSAWKEVAPLVREVRSVDSGRVSGIDARGVGEAALRLGAGRFRKEDAVDPRVGVEVLVSVGDRMEREAPLFRVHALSEDAASEAEGFLRQSLSFGESGEPPALFL